MAAKDPRRRTRFELHDSSGLLVATHIRIDNDDGTKEVIWVDPDGKKGLGGHPLVDLPLYGINSDLVGRSPAVVITEGEKAARALLDADIPAVGTVTGASTIPSPKALADLTGKAVVLWPDADEVGEQHMLGVARNLKGIASKVRWINWPDATEHDDAFDCLARHGVDRTIELIRFAGPVPSNEMKFERRGMGYRGFWRDGRITMELTRLRTHSGALHGELRVTSDSPDWPYTTPIVVGEFNAATVNTRKGWAKDCGERAPGLKVDWRAIFEEFCQLVLDSEHEGLPFTKVGRQQFQERQPYLLYPILPRDRATIVFGRGGSGKSSFAVACAVSIATGRQVFRGLNWEPARPGRVLVVDWEADEAEWNDRVIAVAKGAGIEEPVEIDYRPAMGPITDQVEDLSRYVAEQGIDLIIIDSVGMASPSRRDGADANDSAIRLFQALRSIGTTSLLIDHVRKEDDERGQADPYGSVFKTNLARQTFEMRREDARPGEPDGVGHVTLINRKVNNGPKRRPVGLRVEYGDDGSMAFVHEEVSDAVQTALPIGDRILAAISSSPKTPREIAEELDLKGDTARKTLQRLLERGFVVVLPDGRYGRKLMEVVNG